MDPRYSQYYRELRNEIARSFDSAELKELAFDLDPDFELRGSGRLGKTRALLGYARRSGQLPVLEALIHQKRPYVAWPEPPAWSSDEPTQPGRRSYARFWLLFALVSLGGIAFLIIRNLPDNLPPSIPPASTATLLAVVTGDPTVVITALPSYSPSPDSTPTDTPQPIEIATEPWAKLIGIWRCVACPPAPSFGFLIVKESIEFYDDGIGIMHLTVQSPLSSPEQAPPVNFQYDFVEPSVMHVYTENEQGNMVLEGRYGVSVLDGVLTLRNRGANWEGIYQEE